MLGKITNVGEFLKSNDIKPSYQRMRIFEYLLGSKDHPTVDMIYKELIGEIPTLSKTTVYNTLNLFVEHGIVSRITIEENETRYDADTAVHGHFKCEKCEKVLDFVTDLSVLNIQDIKEFQINQQHLYFRGICSDCLKKGE
ncbi:MAG: transcriptional repressor [Clostridia bacterium]|nr:transcriptional repressor [Clostridia bacterium]